MSRLLGKEGEGDFCEILGCGAESSFQDINKFSIEFGEVIYLNSIKLDDICRYCIYTVYFICRDSL